MCNGMTNRELVVFLETLARLIENTCSGGGAAASLIRELIRDLEDKR